MKRKSYDLGHFNKAMSHDNISNGNHHSTDKTDGNGEEAQLEVEEETEEEVRCDWVMCGPPCIQPLARPACLLFWVCMTSFTQGMIVNGFVNAVLTTLERRHGLQSVESGLIASMYDIGSLVTLVPLTYIGGRFRRSRLISIGTLILSIGCFIFSAPQFATGRYKYTSPVDPLCYYTNKIYPDVCNTENLSIYKWVFWLGQFLNGIGAAPLYTLVVVYLDDNLTTAQCGLYLGIYYTMAVVGPAVGFLLGGLFLDVYVDLGYTPSDITSDNNAEIWIGAWWLGFVIGGVIAAVAVIPLFGFPTLFRGSKKIQASKKLESYGKSSEQSETLNMGAKDFCPSLKILLTNPTFLCISLAGSSGVVLTSALSTFGPKYMQTIFQMKASSATITIGLVAIPCAAVGLFCGGLVLKFKDLTAKQVCLMNMIVSVCGIIGLTCFFIKCQPQSFAGINTNYLNETKTVISLNTTCNTNCHCQVNRYFYAPLCGADELIYYSPCLAGCSENTTIIDNIKYYANCSCIKKTMTIKGANYSAKDGTCVSKTCNGPWGFLALIGFFQFCMFFTNVPALQITMRVVPQKLKNFSMGVQWVFIRVLGSIPGPLLAGVIIDATCTLWNGSCGLQGSCNFYDAQLFWERLFIFSAVFKLIESGFLVLAFILYKAPDVEEKTNLEIPVTNQPEADVMPNGKEDGKTTKGEKGIANPTFVNNT